MLPIPFQVTSELLIMINHNNHLQKCPHPSLQNLKICHIIHGEEALKVARVSELGRLSWTIRVVPVETRVFTRKEEKEQTIRGLRSEDEIQMLALEMKEEGRHEARKVGDLGNCKRLEIRFFPTVSGKECGPPNRDLWWSSDKQNCKVVYLRCFKPLVCGDLLWQQWKTNTDSYLK